MPMGSMHRIQLLTNRPCNKIGWFVWDTIYDTLQREEYFCLSHSRIQLTALFMTPCGGRNTSVWVIRVSSWLLESKFHIDGDLPIRKNSLHHRRNSFAPPYTIEESWKKLSSSIHHSKSKRRRYPSWIYILTSTNNASHHLLMTTDPKRQENRSDRDMTANQKHWHYAQHHLLTITVSKHSHSHHEREGGTGNPSNWIGWTEIAVFRRS